MKWIKLTLISMLTLQAGFSSAQGPATAPVFEMPTERIETRWYTAENKEALKGEGGQANFGRKGSANVYIPDGKTVELVNVEGSGTIRRLWFVPSPQNLEVLRGLRIQMFWDGASEPAVDAPFGDFMGQMHGRMTEFESIYFSSPESRSLNCFVPMPFRTAAKILVTNESPNPLYLFYEINVTTGDVHSDDMLYFHSHWHRVAEVPMREDFEILPKIEGKGRFLGAHLGMKQRESCRDFWWGEGEYKVYLDGDEEWPTLCGTGTEDLIGAGYGQGKFSHLYQGNHYLSPWGSPKGIYPGGDKKVFFSDLHSYYRFHVPDPIYFYEDLRVTIQVMGGGLFTDFLSAMDKEPGLKFMKTGKDGEYWSRKEIETVIANDPLRQTTVERSDDHCAATYWYMEKPTNKLPELAPYEERIKGL